TRVGDEYYVVYVGYSTAGPLVCLATTRDFATWERAGVLQPPDDKDAALFPETFAGRWALIHRPAPHMPGVGVHIWISFSPDLRHWGDAQVLLPARRGGWWDANKIGLGPPPLLTPDGWLLCYHGVRTTASGSIYRLGLALLDRDDPTKVLARGNEWILGPEAPYERQGDVPDVVFPCGWVLRDDGETLHLYYGGADSVVCVAEARLSELLNYLETHPCADGPFPARRRRRRCRDARRHARPHRLAYSAAPLRPLGAGGGHPHRRAHRPRRGRHAVRHRRFRYPGPAPGGRAPRLRGGRLLQRQGVRGAPHRSGVRGRRPVRPDPQPLRLPPAGLEPARRRAHRDDDPRVLRPLHPAGLPDLHRPGALRRHQRRRPPPRADLRRHHPPRHRSGRLSLSEGRRCGRARPVLRRDPSRQGHRRSDRHRPGRRPADPAGRHRPRRRVLRLRS